VTAPATVPAASRFVSEIAINQELATEAVAVMVMVAVMDIAMAAARVPDRDISAGTDEARTAILLRVTGRAETATVVEAVARAAGQAAMARAVGMEAAMAMVMVTATAAVRTAVSLGGVVAATVKAAGMVAAGRISEQQTRMEI